MSIITEMSVEKEEVENGDTKWNQMKQFQPTQSPNCTY